MCDGDRRLLDSHLDEVPDLYERLPDEEPAELDEHTYMLAHPKLGDREYAADPLAVLGGAGPVRGRSRQPRVSGSKEPPAPTSLERIDLTLPARAASRPLFARGQLGLDPDQVGTLSVATILDTWVRDWRATLFPDQRLPIPTVPELARWLGNLAEGRRATSTRRSRSSPQRSRTCATPCGANSARPPPSRRPNATAGSPARSATCRGC